MHDFMTYLKRRQAANGEQTDVSNSLSGLLSTLTPSLIANVGMLTVFFTLRSRLKWVYQPRYLLFPDEFHSRGSDEERSCDRNSRIGWLADFCKQRDETVVQHQSLDAYLLLRFLRTLLKLALGGCLITWPILLPVNSTGGGATSQFDTLAIGNIKDPNRYFAHALVAVVFYSFALGVLYREIRFAVEIRHGYLLSPKIRNRLSSRTVLFTDVPEELRNHKDLLGLLRNARNAWFSPDWRILNSHLAQRDEAVRHLESCIIAGSRIALSQWNRHKQHEDGHEGGEHALRYVNSSGRPRHRPSWLSLRKVDSIRHYSDQLGQLLEKIEKLRTDAGAHTKLPFVFVEFSTIEAAEAALQRTIHHKPESLQARCRGLEPSDVIWSNLRLPCWSRYYRRLGAHMTVGLLIMFWSPIAASIGVLSNIDYAAALKPFSWSKTIPPQIIGVLTGLAPSIVLTVIMAMVPTFLRLLAGACGTASFAAAERLVQRWYFLFQVVQVFLVVTIGSSATAVVAQLQSHPTSATRLLAASLPKASNFYINYFTMYGLATSASALLDYGSLFSKACAGRVMDDTPRKRWVRSASLPGVPWGTIYPQLTMLGVIFLAYAIIAPLILGFAAIAISFLYGAFRYGVFYTLDCNSSAAHGLFHISALRQITTGVYIGQLCLIGLFCIRTIDSLVSIGPALITVILLFATAIAHDRMMGGIQPLVQHLPQISTTELVRGSTSTGAGHRSRIQPLQRLSPYLKRAAAGSRRETSETYLHPAFHRSQTNLWVVPDGIGFVDEVSSKLGSQFKINQSGAWWSDDGRLQTILEEDCVDISQIPFHPQE